MPPDWIADVQAATEDGFFALAEHLPAEAAEALLDYAVGSGRRPGAPCLLGADPFAHPDAQRRFRVVDDQAELAAALDAPWDRWIVFLHPAQQGVVDRGFTGPARVTGSAGTGKTVVALHRAVRLARAAPAARVLLTTFSRRSPRRWTGAWRRSTARAAGPPAHHRLPLRAVADELFQLAFGHRATPASDEQVRTRWRRRPQRSATAATLLRFILSEWRHVVDAWQIADLEAYARVPRLGRKSRMSAGQRERLWPVFAARARLACPARAADVGADLRRGHRPATPPAPPSRSTMWWSTRRRTWACRSCACSPPSRPTGPDALFFAGDAGQRIFQQPFSWSALGVDVRGRSSTLTRELPHLAPDPRHGGQAAARRRAGRGRRRRPARRTVSVFEGPVPAARPVRDLPRRRSRASRTG